jgi:fatty acid desaturase
MSIATNRDFKDIELARKLVENLYTPRLSIYWLDLILTSVVAWSSFALACNAKPLSLQMWIAATISVFAFYRGSAFVHELSHLNPKRIHGFATIWNLIIGVPLLYPDFLYVGLHSEHHRLSTYGTDKDPQYLPSEVTRKLVVNALIQSVLAPGLLAFRFLLLSFFGLLYSPFHNFLEQHASASGMNKKYCRKVSPEERRHIITIELLIVGIWSCFIFLACIKIISWHIFTIWYAVMAGILLISTLEGLREHRFQPENSPPSITAQLLDSNNTNTFFAVFWGPVGFRFHALHHLFPNIPYHNLPIAHQRLMEGLPTGSIYHQANSSSMWHSLKTLWYSLN